MYTVVDRIESFVRPVVEHQGMILIDVVLRGKQRGRVLEVFVDSEQGVTTEMCAEVSRQLSRELDRVNVLEGNYTLVVSSPGVDRPLKFPVQYKKNVGREIEITFHDGTLEKTLKGILLNCTENEVHIQSAGNLHSIPYSEIIQAKVMLPW